jgi:hypothetical protein
VKTPISGSAPTATPAATLETAPPADDQGAFYYNWRDPTWDNAMYDVAQDQLTHSAESAGRMISLAEYLVTSIPPHTLQDRNSGADEARAIITMGMLLKKMRDQAGRTYTTPMIPTNVFEESLAATESPPPPPTMLPPEDLNEDPPAPPLQMQEEKEEEEEEAASPNPTDNLTSHLDSPIPQPMDEEDWRSPLSPVASPHASPRRPPPVSHNAPVSTFSPSVRQRGRQRRKSTSSPYTKT